MLHLYRHGFPACSPSRRSNTPFSPGPCRLAPRATSRPCRSIFSSAWLVPPAPIVRKIKRHLSPSCRLLARLGSFFAPMFVRPSLTVGRFLSLVYAASPVSLKLLRLPLFPPDR